MRILMITPYVTIAGRKEFERNKTGFGYMVHDIAKAVGMQEHVEVLAADSRGEEFKKDGVVYLKRSLWTLLINSFRCVKLRVLSELFKQYKLSTGEKIRLLYHWVMTGYLDRLLARGRYDIVHIHGCTFADDLWIAACRKRYCRLIVTLHGLNSFSDTVRLSEAGKQYERVFLKRVVDGEFPITVISTGMKRRIEKTYDRKDCKNISVVCNSFSF